MPRPRRTKTSYTDRTISNRKPTITSRKTKTTKRGIAGGDTARKAGSKAASVAKGFVSGFKSARKKAKGVRAKHRGYGKKNRAKLKSGASKAYSKLKRGAKKAYGR